MRMIGLATIVVFALTLAPKAQTEKPQDPQQPPRFRTEARFVRVDAYPVKDGKPVIGLKAEDFEVFEDGTPQKIEAFEHVVVRAADATERIDPGSQRAALQAVANPRNRVFVIFLDTTYVDVGSAHAINEPLIRFINRILGPDDLVGIMTPAMAASQVVFARKTEVIEESLRKNWAWGTRFTLHQDQREESYDICYPPKPGEGQHSAMASEMIERKRERATLEALEDLVRYLRNIREERKAIITVTEGWVLYREHKGLMNVEKTFDGRDGPPPGLDPVGVGPNGKLTTRDPRRVHDGLTKNECDTDRLRLATMDNWQYFRDILQEANYGNASFYPIDPRGLTAFDFPIYAAVPMGIDQAYLKKRLDVIQELAINTDGVAVVNDNDLDRGLRRMSDDLTSYYLLGYYSSNDKMDGGLRQLKVRVKQPGVTVRARRGYRAPSVAEVAAARKAADAPVPDATRVVQTAIARLDGIRPEIRFHINAVALKGTPKTVWVAGELQPAVGKADEFAQGGTADIEAMSGPQSATTRVILKPGERTFLATLSLPRDMEGDLDIRARVAPVENKTASVTDSLKLAGDAAGLRPLFFRRGPANGNRWLPAADVRFSRTERVRLEIPVGARTDAAIKGGTARMLDRTGKALEIPVTVAERVDETSGQRWITAEVVLAPLAAGDYAMEVELVNSAGSERVVTAFRVAR